MDGGMNDSVQIDTKSQKQSVHGSQRSGSRREANDNGEAASQQAMDEMGENDEDGAQDGDEALDSEIEDKGSQKDGAEDEA